MTKIRNKKAVVWIFAILLALFSVFPVIVRADTVKAQNIIDNTTFISFKKYETEASGRTIIACLYIPNSVYDAECSYGLIIIPKKYLEHYEIKSDYIKQFEEKNVMNINYKNPGPFVTDDGVIFKIGLSKILDQNTSRTFAFIFYVTDTDGNTAYATPQFADYDSLLATDYTNAELIELADQKVKMESSFNSIVVRLSELVNSFWIYIVMVLGSAVVVWGAVIGVKIAIAKRKEEKIDSRAMLKNLIIGIIVMAGVAAFIPLLIKGLAAWVTL